MSRSSGGMEVTAEIKNAELNNLLDHVVKNAYRARESDIIGETILNNCLRLFSEDYKFSVVSNNHGELCSHYPTKIVLLEYSTTSAKSDPHAHESLHDIQGLKELFNKAKYARCRSRFPVPVILYNDKHICRGATISGGVEIYGRSGLDFFLSRSENFPDVDPFVDIEGSSSAQSSSLPMGGSAEGHLFTRIRGQDIKVLKTFNVSYICDLMVEKKKVKFGMNVTSSEKVDKENRYSDFTIFSLPYPGCEFFRDWRDNGYMAEGMMFDWSQGYVDALLDLPGHLPPPPGINWKKYMTWDLVQLSQNYLLLLLHYIREGNGGLLVHCISGWDRTPLFISLLRLSLWADGAIHQSLGPIDILYLTIAYDWFLFGHNFPDRIAKGEDIFFFCFNCLKYIVEEKYSIHCRTKRKTRKVSGLSTTETEFDGLLPLRSKQRTTSGLSATDSDFNFDGVLLENDLPRRQSELSLNSNSSLNSSRSSIDGLSHIRPEDSSIANGLLLNIGSLPHQHAHSAPSNRTNSSESHSNKSDIYVNCASSIPVSVPGQSISSTGYGHSPGYGSWQIVSGTGSLMKNSASSGESTRSAGSSAGLTSQKQLLEESIEEAEAAVEYTQEESVRKQRLDAVRRIFLGYYSTMMNFQLSSDASGFSGLLDQFAEKVGIKAGRSTTI